LYVPLSVRLSPKKKMFENWADASVALSDSAIATTASEIRRCCMLTYSLVETRVAMRSGEHLILVQRFAQIRTVNACLHLHVLNR